MDPYVGEIRMFAGNFAPKGWAFCNGQLIPIQQNTALFSILGTHYGGDGKTTFALPNLNGRVPIGKGLGPGLTTRNLGEQGGSSTVTLLNSQMPHHTHIPQASASKGNTESPEGAVWAQPAGRRPPPAYGGPGGEEPLHPSTIAPAGGSQPHNNMQPYLALSFIIALQGVYPQRP